MDELESKEDDLSTPDAAASSSPDEEDVDVATASAGALAIDAAVAAPAILADPIFWIDLEMTGLDPTQHTILEIAIIASDGALRTLVEGPNECIHHDEATLGAMNEWSQTQHASLGLTERCRSSRVQLADAEEMLLAFVRQHAGGRPAVLGGACVYKDKEFLDRHMPQLCKCLSHRVVDVSTLRELARRWQPTASRRAPRGESNHRAIDDIRYSIEECRYYRDSCWKPMEGQRRRRNQ